MITMITWVTWHGSTMVAGDGSQVVVVVMMVQASDVSTNQSGVLMLSGDVTCRAYAVDQDGRLDSNSKILRPVLVLMIRLIS